MLDLYTYWKTADKEYGLEGGRKRWVVEVEGCLVVNVERAEVADQGEGWKMVETHLYGHVMGNEEI